MARNRSLVSAGIHKGAGEMTKRKVKHPYSSDCDGDRRMHESGLCGCGKVLTPGHGFNSERSQRAENGGRP